MDTCFWSLALLVDFFAAEATPVIVPDDSIDFLGAMFLDVLETRWGAKRIEK